jgi:excisionase family DNA binding protein
MSRKQIHKTSRLHSKSDRPYPLVGDVPAWARDASYGRVVDGGAVASSSLLAFDQKALSSPNLLTIANVAASLQVSTKTVRRLIDRCELDAIRIGRSIRIQPEALKLLIGRRAR